MAKNVEGGRLSFTGDLAAAVDGADAVFIAVGTPTRRGDGHADLTYVYAAAEEIARALTGYAVVVTKSTVPVGTNFRVRDIIRECRPDAEFDVASNPEFLREGAAIDDFMRPDRVVVGVESERAAEVMAELYRPLYLRDFPIVRTDIASAEMIKYAANAFLATKITFINEIAMLCEKRRRRRQGGGEGDRPRRPDRQQIPACRPRLWRIVLSQGHAALARIGQEHGAPMRIVETVIAVNDAVKRRMIDKILDLLDGSVNGKTILVLGVTFKPNTDDMRDAPALTIVPALVGGGAKVTVVDPQGQREGEHLLPGVTWSDDPYEGAARRRRRGAADRVERVPRAGPQAAAPRRWRATSWSTCATSTCPRTPARRASATPRSDGRKGGDGPAGSARRPEPRRRACRSPRARRRPAPRRPRSAPAGAGCRPGRRRARRSA